MVCVLLEWVFLASRRPEAAFAAQWVTPPAGRRCQIAIRAARRTAIERKRRRGNALSDGAFWTKVEGLKRLEMTGDYSISAHRCGIVGAPPSARGRTDPPVLSKNDPQGLAEPRAELPPRGDGLKATPIGASFPIQL